MRTTASPSCRSAESDTTILCRVEKQIHEYLLQSFGVCLQPYRWNASAHSLITLLHCECDGRCRVSHDDAQIHSFALQGQLAVSDA
jgi:hypothetical protein